MDFVHLPVLAREVIEALAPHEGGIYADATVGLGGHSEMVLSKIGQNGRVVGMDRDEKALELTASRLDDRRLLLRKSPFSQIERSLREEGITEVDGVLFDLGVSMMQLRDHARGFSFQSSERLDMRMDRSQPVSAWEIVNNFSETELAEMIREYGEEYRASRVARAIVNARAAGSIDTCSDLENIVFRALGRHGRIHPATKTFQALRIAVNNELGELTAGLAAAAGILKKGGRLCVISYHSLEDRIVKHFIREGSKSGMLRPLTKKPVVPSAEEMKHNPSSRSAKLRGAEKI
jgi:16S rRNA (cytosine1402-N4)-methyltransferase